MTLTVSQILKDEYDIQSVYGEDYRIYMVREGDTVFYVGQSKNIPDRLGHCPAGTSELGRLILRNRSASLDWQIELMTVADCMPFEDPDGQACLEAIRAVLAEDSCNKKSSSPYPIQDAGQGGLEAVREVMENKS